MTSARYISITETAKLVRARLKQEFPGVKFKVKSEKYSMGGAINVFCKNDGPDRDAVDTIIHQYESKRFDGMIDYGWNVDHWLKSDGSTIVARNSGSTSCGGCYEAEFNEKPEGAELVWLAADYVSYYKGDVYFD